MSRVAVVGAGMAGLACARGLAASGHAVRLFDKGRGVGGRIATRRLDGIAFNHGAQWATGRDPAFVALLSAWQRDGVASPWPAATGDGEPRWVGVPSMTALPRALADADIALRRHVSFLHREPGGWMLRHTDAALAAPGSVGGPGGDQGGDQGSELAGPFDRVALALPSPQAAALLRAIGHDFHDFADAAASATYAPCWSVLAAFADRVPGPDVLREAGDALGWMARESSRPGALMVPGRDAWTLHATGDWSRAHLEDEPASVIAALLAAFAARTGATGAPLSVAAHRWRYAKVERALGQPCLWDAARSLGACGDWCLGGRVEAAFMSGQALAAAMSGGT